MAKQMCFFITIPPLCAGSASMVLYAHCKVQSVMSYTHSLLCAIRIQLNVKSITGDRRLIVFRGHFHALNSATQRVMRRSGQAHEHGLGWRKASVCSE